MSQRNDYRREIDAFIAKAGTRFTMVGTAVGITPIVYATVLGMLYGFAPPPAAAAPDAAAGDQINMLAALLASVACMSLPLPPMLLRLLTRNAVATAASVSPPQERIEVLQAAYFRAAMIASAVAETPAVFALVLGLCLYHVAGATPLDMPWVILACAGMGLEALLLLAAVVPTAGRVERFLLDAFEQPTR